MYTFTFVDFRSAVTFPIIGQGERQQGSERLVALREKMKGISYK